MACGVQIGQHLICNVRFNSPNFRQCVANTLDRVFDGRFLSSAPPTSTAQPPRCSSSDYTECVDTDITDKLLHQLTTININDESYRLRDRKMALPQIQPKKGVRFHPPSRRLRRCIAKSPVSTQPRSRMSNEQRSTLRSPRRTIQMDIQHEYGSRKELRRDA